MFKEEKEEDDINKFNHVQLPNKLFYGIKEKSILQKLNQDDNVLLILDYLFFSVNRKNIVVFNLEHLILSCGYKDVNNRKGRNVEQFKIILNYLQEIKYIKSINNETLVFQTILIGFKYKASNLSKF